MLGKVCLIVALLFHSSLVAAQDGCNVKIAELLQRASTLGATTAYNQMKLGDPPKTSDLSCIQAILEFQIDMLIKLPNLSQLLGEIIDRTCNAARRAVQDASQSLSYQFDANSVLGNGVLGNIPTNTYDFSKGINFQNSVAKPGRKSKLKGLFR